MKLLYFSMTLPMMLASLACTHRGGDDSQQLTVGTVQKEIRKGMTGAEVASVLGSPNIVSTDDEGNEVWIYDKISSSVSTSQSYGTLILIGGSSAKSNTQQKTLTVIINFDSDKRVSDFKYHTSRF